MPFFLSVARFGRTLPFFKYCTVNTLFWVRPIDRYRVPSSVHRIRWSFVLNPRSLERDLNSLLTHATHSLRNSYLAPPARPAVSSLIFLLHGFFSPGFVRVGQGGLRRHNTDPEASGSRLSISKSVGERFFCRTPRRVFLTIRARFLGPRITPRIGERAGAGGSRARVLDLRRNPNSRRSFTRSLVPTRRPEHRISLSSRNEKKK